MNDSLDLRNRILEMRKSNNLTINKKDTLNNDLMSKFESSIESDNQSKSNPDKNIVNDKNRTNVAKSVENLTQKVRSENKILKNNVNDNEAQFLMLANKFNEAVEVILELSEKVENLEKSVSQNPYKLKNNIKSSSFFNFKIIVFLLLIPIMVIGFFTLPFDLSFIKSIIIDIIAAL